VAAVAVERGGARRGRVELERDDEEVKP